MSKLQKEFRQNIEDAIDRMLKNPKEYDDIISSQLLAQDIEPTLERVLCAISGYLYGRIRANYWYKYKQSHLTRDELSDFHDLMRRRTIELREAMTLVRHT